MKKIIVISLVLIMATGILLAQRAANNPNPGMHAMHQGGTPMQKCVEELNLSEAQMQKFAESRAVYEKQENTLSAEIQNLKLDVMAAMKAENFKLVRELNKQISDKELALMNARVDLMMNHMKELNKDQKAIMLKNMPMMMGHGQQFGAKNAKRGRMMNRRAPGMGERRHDCDDCDDCDGERQYKNRK